MTESCELKLNQENRIPETLFLLTGAWLSWPHLESVCRHNEMIHQRAVTSYSSAVRESGGLQGVLPTDIYCSSVGAFCDGKRARHCLSRSLVLNRNGNVAYASIACYPELSFWAGAVLVVRRIGIAQVSYSVRIYYPALSTYSEAFRLLHRVFYHSRSSSDSKVIFYSQKTSIA